MSQFNFLVTLMTFCEQLFDVTDYISFVVNFLNPNKEKGSIDLNFYEKKKEVVSG